MEFYFYTFIFIHLFYSYYAHYYYKKIIKDLEKKNDLLDYELFRLKIHKNEILNDFKKYKQKNSKLT